MLLSYICFLIVYSANVSAQSAVGDSCTLESNNAAGQCVLLKDCPGGIENIQKRIYPQICGYQGLEPIVCCEKQTPKRPVGDICKQKCKEYGEKVYVWEKPPVFEQGAEAIQINTCEVIVAPLVVGGEDAHPREFPHMTLLGYREEEDEIKWLCGGTLISEHFVLTAAHCLKSRDFGPLRWIRVGELVLGSNTDEAGPKDFSVLESIAHPQYLPPSQYNDIGLVKVDGQIKLNRFVRPACLHTTTFINATRYIATGWGLTEFLGNASDVLQKVTLDSFSQDRCNTSFESNISTRTLKYGIVPETQMCAGGNETAKDTCQGDSGGPLQIYHKDVYCMYEIVGVTSFGKTCGIAGIPGVYTRVSQYIDWIEKIVWPEN